MNPCYSRVSVACILLWNVYIINPKWPKSLIWRFLSMIIDKVLAVYNMSPLLLVVESDEGKLFELSLKDLKTAGYIFSDAAWKSLVEDYRIFNSQHAPR
jgi:hypothetical protein